MCVCVATNWNQQTYFPKCVFTDDIDSANKMHSSKTKTNAMGIKFLWILAKYQLYDVWWRIERKCSSTSFPNSVFSFECISRNAIKFAQKVHRKFLCNLLLTESKFMNHDVCFLFDKKGLRCLLFSSILKRTNYHK